MMPPCRPRLPCFTPVFPVHGSAPCVRPQFIKFPFIFISGLAACIRNYLQIGDIFNLSVCLLPRVNLLRWLKSISLRQTCKYGNDNLSQNQDEAGLFFWNVKTSPVNIWRQSLRCCKCAISPNYLTVLQRYLTFMSYALNLQLKHILKNKHLWLC